MGSSQSSTGEGRKTKDYLHKWDISTTSDCSSGNLQTMEHILIVISVNLDHTAPIMIQKKRIPQHWMVEVLVRQSFIVYFYR